MNTVLFTDTATVRDEQGVRPIRDQFLHFFRHVASNDLHLTVCARTKPREAGEGVEALPLDERLRFVDLPFYRNTEDYYRHLPRVVLGSLPSVIREVRAADVVVLRIHHCLALFVWIVTMVFRRPLVLYWAGPPIEESARQNYPGSSLRERIAVAVAGAEQALAMQIARTACAHFFVDRREHALMGRPEPALTVVPTLVSEAASEPAEARGPTGVNVVFLGRILRHKGVFELLDAFEAIAGDDAEVRLSFVGGGDDLERLASRVAASQHSDRIEVHGNVTHIEAMRHLREGAIFCLPSWAEGLPKVLWEAWTCGLAVVMTDVGSVSDYLRDGVNGLLVEPGNRDQLHAALLQVTRDESLRSRLAREGRETARHHSLERSVTRIREVLQHHGRPR